MKRRTLRMILMAALLASAAFAAWTWFRPYAWNPDPAARGEILGALVQKDHSYFWVDLRVKITQGQTHDLSKPVFLVTSQGRTLEAADTTLVGEEGGGTTDVWFKFWLESSEIEGPLTLRINDGSLTLKANSGIPDLGDSGRKSFTTNHW